LDKPWRSSSAGGRKRARLTTAYFTSQFLGGVAGATPSGAAYAAGGWPDVVVAGAAFTFAALAVWAIAVLRGIDK
jgi:hypothetical protein